MPGLDRGQTISVRTAKISKETCDFYLQSSGVPNSRIRQIYTTGHTGHVLPGRTEEQHAVSREIFFQGEEKERVGLHMPSFPIKLLINQLQSFPFPAKTSWVGRGQEHLLMAIGQY